VAHRITEECINCGACESECSSDSISEGDETYVINSETCTDCGDCVEACPTEAIVAE
jgi:NAD-dependent dihydropyrimidine dehydrogenase PreA subunit